MPDLTEAFLADVANGTSQQGTLKLGSDLKKINSERASALARALSSENCIVTELHLEDNCLDAKGFSILSTAFQHPHCKVTGIFIWNCDQMVLTLPALANAMQSVHCRLEKLSFYDSLVGDKGLESLCAALQNENCKLAYLTLGEDLITSRGLKLLVDAMSNKNCKLIELDLASNQIDFEGIQPLSIALRTGKCKLTLLSLSRNRIDSTCVEALSHALQSRSCQLKYLAIRSNHIGVAGAKSLAEALQSNRCKLRALDVGICGIGQEGVVALANAVQCDNCKTLKRHGSNPDALLTSSSGGIHLPSSSDIGPEAIFELSIALRCASCKIANLSLFRNPIGLSGLEAVRSALQSDNCKLTELYYDKGDDYEPDQVVESILEENRGMLRNGSFIGSLILHSGIPRSIRLECIEKLKNSNLNREEAWSSPNIAKLLIQAGVEVDNCIRLVSAYNMLCPDYWVAPVSEWSAKVMKGSSLMS